MGKAYLVGAGPGDPGLITVKGLEWLKKAQVVLYDRLVSDELLRHVSPTAELIPVGKTPGGQSLSQEQINAILVSEAQQGKRVVRLKGGDPFVFGRGGEEALALAEAGIPFEVVPGVTSAVAVPAYAGIPVTHRGLASSFAVITGHEAPAKGRSRLRWHRLATAADTLVLLMGMGQLSEVVQELLVHGRSPHTPIALVRWGTTPRQETLVGTLGDIVVRVQEKGFGPPAVLVVGEVVGLREKLGWFEGKPLFGRRVLVTRSRPQARYLSKLLQGEGALAVELPTLQIAPLANYQALDQALDRLAAYHWLVLTSVNGVEAFFQRLHGRGLDARALAGVKIACIGAATAGALAQQGLRADLVPSDFTTQGIVSAFAQGSILGQRLLLPRVAGAPEALTKGLAALGGQVDEVPAYQTVLPAVRESKALELLLAGQVDVVACTSSSTVKNLVALLDGNLAALRSTCLACIGPVTAQTARNLDLRVDVVAEEHTIPGLVEALKRWFQR